MNYLAHFYLSGSHEHLLLGNFIADAVKGKQLEAYSDELQRGIRMHRAIDFYTDTHPVTSRSKDRLRGQFNHYSGVIVDIFYDHFLARNWDEFSKEPLSEYSQRIYSLLEVHAANFPDRPRHMLPFMKNHDWLMTYRRIEGIRNVLTGMSRRAKFESKMELAADVLEKDYEFFEKDFREFFPQLILHTEEFRTS
ncbi:MAG TPA: ACP phosphodiesterase [Bacteroidia bacterium]|nr:ACP phosphodiesterase [Bacteroidia bacterium]